MREAIRFLVDGREQVRAPLRAEIGPRIEQARDGGLDRGKRTAQVMRDRGEQRGLDLVGLLERRGPSRPLGQVGLVDSQRRLVRKGGEEPFLLLAERSATS